MSTNISQDSSRSANQEIDARGPRFGAAITTIVLAIVLLTQSIELLAVQTAVFAIGGFIGPQHSPYAFIYRKFVKPRLKSPLITEDSRPPQFSQLVGFVFTLVGFIGLATNTDLLFTIAIAGALFAAFLNAAFAFCLGCEMYLRGRQIIAKFRSF
ncbi:MAG: DUF4395 family protein [Actinobacteria bacterium]|jgi:hypothetical protein|uniref:Unannotated protein n=1 Tax=freshwater metagenome TaxID=449393 RepID=A0A6J6E5T3_9ZZZZ|nr:DUF4395 family protein [Actinomycetota bacterium]